MALNYTLAAQTNDRSTNRYRFEIALDAIPFFKETTFGDTYIKYFSYKNDEIKGAYRLKIISSYSYLSLPESEYKEKNHFNHNRLTLGYEKHISLFNSVFYYGSDLSGNIIRQKHEPADLNDYRSLSLEIIPFMGVRKQIIDFLSFSFEAGWHHSVQYEKKMKVEPVNTKHSRIVSYTMSSSIPYAFTINYRF